MTQHEGLQLGNYYLERKLGEGGMGEVYAARDVTLQRQVAVKVMHAHVAAHEVFRMRFIQEARSAAALEHPNIVSIYTFDIAPDGEHYLVMEFVPSGSLRDYMQQLSENGQMIDVSEALTFIQQIASALDFAHNTNTVHRDIKPDNVLLKNNTSFGYGTPGFTAVLTDFGLAKIVQGHNLVQTQVDNPMGTLPYMAPEQFTGQSDHRADLYALGIMMYEMLAGHLPFLPHNPHEALQMHTHQPPPPPRASRPDLIPALEPIILKALAKHPDHRFQSGREIIQVISQVMGGYTALGSNPPSVPASSYEQQQYQQSSQPQASSGRAYILLEREGYAPKTVAITKDLITVGRDPARDLPLAGGNISRMHAHIERESDGTFLITDLSTNGTFMYGQRLQRQEAVEITGPVAIGPYILTIRID